MYTVLLLLASVGQLTTPPSDSEELYLSVVGRGPSYYQVVEWFRTDADLANLRDQVHFYTVMPNTAVYEARYAKTIKELPTIRLQRASGEVIYEVWGAKIPGTADLLASDLEKVIQTSALLPWRRDRVAPVVTPKPTVPSLPSLPLPQLPRFQPKKPAQAPNVATLVAALVLTLLVLNSKRTSKKRS